MHSVDFLSVSVPCTVRARSVIGTGFPCPCRARHGHGHGFRVHWDRSVTVFSVQFFYNGSELSMSWYSDMRCLFPLYVLPPLTVCVGVYVVVSFLIAKKGENHFMARALHDAVIFIHCILLLWLTSKRIASGYIFSVLAFFPLLRDTLLHVQHGFFLSTSSTAFVITHIVTSLPGIGMTMYLIVLVLEVFIPVMARMPNANPEAVIGGFCGIGVVIVAFALSPLILASRPKTQRWLLTAAIALTVVGQLAVIRHGVPYAYTVDQPRTRRMQVFHTRRHVESAEGHTVVDDSGIMTIAQDARGIDDVPFVDNNYLQLPCNLSNSKYCELPYLYSPRTMLNHKQFRYMPVREDLQIENPVSVHMVSKVSLDSSVDYRILVEGSGQISLFLVAQPPYQLKGWRLFASQEEGFVSNGSFAQFHCVGQKCGQWEIFVQLETKSKPVNPTPKALLVGAAAHYVHGPDMQSQTLMELIKEIHEKRSKPSLWKWAITASAWNVDFKQLYL